MPTRTPPVVATRQATSADRDWIFALHRAAIAGYVEQTWGLWDEAWQRRHFDEHFAPAGDRILVVDGVDVGLLRVIDRGDELFLADIEILPAHQGRGIGGVALRDLQSLARVRGVPITLRVFRCNGGARRLYERLGFAAEGRTASHVSMRWRPA